MDDPYRWLEEVEGDAALAWVRDRNAEAEAALFTDPGFVELRGALLTILEADDRIPMPSVHGDEVRNFWTDGSHRRGLWRRTTWDRYLSDDPEWEVLLDVDALGAEEGESWVFAGADIRTPDRERALVALSPGGSDATTTREFDLITKRFVPEAEGGFVRPLAKGWMTWIDDDTVYVATDFGDGSMTRSGYPRTVRRWSRGTPMADAPVVFEGSVDDMGVWGGVDTLEGARHHVFRRRHDFYSGETHLLRDGRFVRLDVPDDAEATVRDRWVFAELRSDWTVGGRTLAAGSLVAADLEGFVRGDAMPEPLFEPTPDTSLAGWSFTRDHVVLNLLADVRSRIEVCRPRGADWERTTLPGAPDVWTVAASPVEPDDSDDLWLTVDDFVTPPALLRTTIGADGPAPVKSSPARFDAAGLTVAQRFVTSADGTRVPYFVVSDPERGGAPGPTLLGGYGGFEVPNVAAYAGVLGRGWLEAGGTYVLANLRGGGEYGPAWHQAGLREQRHRVYEDFEAVARDLIDTGMTTPAQLGCSGGSNGGLLVGNMYVRCPELWGAIVCQVPLLDMKRYPHLLAGASWMAEYGDPDTDDWDFIRTFSPYHLVDPDATYPPLLLTTSTKDDRVHPGHARKMAAKLRDAGKDVTYWENIEGGHGGAADAPQQATMRALTYTFLRRHLMG
jgi:prolyl oligopeptidase